LYSIVFEYFAIPYQNRELPTNVYIIAYAGEPNITVESIVLENGIGEFYKKSMEQYKDQLEADKILTRAEVEDDNFIRQYWLGDITFNTI